MKSLIIFAVFPVIFIVGLGENLDVVRYRQEALRQHNQYRSECHVANLRSNATLDQKADEWCKKMAEHKIFEHSGGIDNGENSFMKNPFDFQRDNGATPVTFWYERKKNYATNNTKDALEFTQLVWKSTTDLGIGVCQDSQGGVIFVALYYPRGNYDGHFAENVLC